MLPTAFYFIPSAMTGFIVSVFPSRNRVSSQEAFEGLELGEGKPSRPVLRGPGGRKATWLLGSYDPSGATSEYAVRNVENPYNIRSTRDLSLPIAFVHGCHLRNRWLRVK